jgi:phenylalanyl-tRNA synthetase beta chain
LFEFHPKLVETGRAAALDLDLAIVQKLEPPAARYRPLRRFPASAFDLSVVAGPRVLIGDVQARLEELAGEQLLSIEFLREFTLAGGNRSVSYRMTVGAPDRTLAAEEVGAVRSRIIEGMQAAGYQLRV